ncbi:hypothetical protein A2116_01685 [Candidatus Jorgensenbacteria bacterium GWA1_49_17]|uniref:Uncharacterized protein n=2 Tax=Candidatus Joergenseniibacteriota TaxID=1752739 RepID=A0A1F6BQQ8_9BACT|nr:MAG: hypothetical protein A2127_02020 [Candidatus Jorgensenbacteria bacterium GWC1_48_12]OGG40377.1 MAG: hypothetical protein A2116_01685 [Candidatus Jorgensenbacteria bacterium GWA1_49_17]
MRQLEKGLYLLEGEEMPCGPGTIDVRRKALLSTFGKAEREWAAVLIIGCSQEVGTWVAVDWPTLGRKAMEKEYSIGKLFVGIRGLIKMGFVRRVRPGNNIRNHPAFSPVPKFVLHLMKLQGITPKN